MRLEVRQEEGGEEGGEEQEGRSQEEGEGLLPENEYLSASS